MSNLISSAHRRYCTLCYALLDQTLHSARTVELKAVLSEKVLYTDDEVNSLQTLSISHVAEKF